ncbi:MAG: OmpH family outer membrane protein [Acidobacteriota bacterium]|nr:MAG: OmpH family outer membrane protein [Acidobacteriota bacterium]
MIPQKLRSAVLISAAGLWVLAVGAGPVSAQQLKIGVFDPDRIVQETREGARLQARLNALQESKRSELDRLQEEIRTLEQEFYATATSLSADRLKEMQIKIDRKRFELESAQKSASRELQLEVEQTRIEWQQRVLRVVETFGEEQGYSLIFQVEVVGYFSPMIDVTEELIRRIDAQQEGATAP